MMSTFGVQTQNNPCFDCLKRTATCHVSNQCSDRAEWLIEHTDSIKRYEALRRGPDMARDFIIQSMDKIRR